MIRKPSRSDARVRDITDYVIKYPVQHNNQDWQYLDQISIFMHRLLTI